MIELNDEIEFFFDLDELDFDRLKIENQPLSIPLTPRKQVRTFFKINPTMNDNIQIDGRIAENIESGKKTRKILYTPNRADFEEGNCEEYFDHQRRIITVDNLGMNLQGID